MHVQFISSQLDQNFVFSFFFLVIVVLVDYIGCQIIIRLQKPTATLVSFLPVLTHGAYSCIYGCALPFHYYSSSTVDLQSNLKIYTAGFWLTFSCICGSALFPTQLLTCNCLVGCALRFMIDFQLHPRSDVHTLLLCFMVPLDFH